MKAGGETVAPVADWETKRQWVRDAFAELERAGYHVGSAYTAVKIHRRHALSIAICCGAEQT
jgi:hypothetical protein